MRLTRSLCILCWAWLSLALLGCGALAHLLHGGSPLAPLSSRFSFAHFRPGPNYAALRLAAASAPAFGT